MNGIEELRCKIMLIDYYFILCYVTQQHQSFLDSGFLINCELEKYKLDHPRLM